MICSFVSPVNLKRLSDSAGRRWVPVLWPGWWGLDRLTHDMTLAVDLFAHTWNRKSDVFFSYRACPFSAGVDVFALDWTDHCVWVCPPVMLVIPTIKKICAKCMSAILTVPCWRSAAYWTTLFPDVRTAIAQCWKLESFHPHVVRGKFCYNRALAP